MSNKDVDFTKVSIPADEFDAMMRRALDSKAPEDGVSVKPKAEKPKSSVKTNRGSSS